MHHAPDVIDDEEDEIASWTPDPDPVSAALGAAGYLHRYTLEDCVERFDNSQASRFPETFDRFYFDTPHGRLLVDLLQDGTPEQLRLERERKRVEFKTVWCETNGWRYLPLAESDATPEKIRALLAGPSGDEPRPHAARKPPARRGGIQRPKAPA